MKHTTADGLSCQLSTKEELAMPEKDINDFINAQINSVQIYPVSVEDADEDILSSDYTEESENIARYLTFFC